MREIGIASLRDIGWGDLPLTAEGVEVDELEEEQKDDGVVPVFWGCGVTPQLAVMNARIPGVVMGHSPGYMVVLDAKEEDVLGKL